MPEKWISQLKKMYSTLETKTSKRRKRDSYIFCLAMMYDVKTFLGP
jgi:hypothetical protein